MSVFEKKITLYNNVLIPMFGFGTYKINEKILDDATSIIKNAFDCGYRLIDSAEYYQNSKEIGDAIKKSGIQRNDLFIVSKIFNYDSAYADAKKCFLELLKKLNTTYIDLMLVHWPTKKSLECYRVLEEYYEKGLIKAIGVSNFTKVQLEDFISRVKIKPMVNQIQLNPHHNRQEILDYCQKKNIAVMSWQTLDKGAVISDPIINSIAKKYQKKPEQIVFRWLFQKNIILIPKTIQKSRMISNSDFDDFKLSSRDIELIESIEQKEIFWPFPEFGPLDTNWE